MSGKGKGGDTSSTKDTVLVEENKPWKLHSIEVPRTALDELRLSTVGSINYSEDGLLWDNVLIPVANPYFCVLLDKNDVVKSLYSGQKACTINILRKNLEASYHISIFDNRYYEYICVKGIGFNVDNGTAIMRDTDEDGNSGTKLIIITAKKHHMHDVINDLTRNVRDLSERHDKLDNSFNEYRKSYNEERTESLRHQIENLQQDLQFQLGDLQELYNESLGTIDELESRIRTLNDELHKSREENVRDASSTTISQGSNNDNGFASNIPNSVKDDIIYPLYVDRIETEGYNDDYWYYKVPDNTVQRVKMKSKIETFGSTVADGELEVIFKTKGVIGIKKSSLVSMGISDTHQPFLDEVHRISMSVKSVSNDVCDGPSCSVSQVYSGGSGGGGMRSRSSNSQTLVLPSTSSKSSTNKRPSKPPRVPEYDHRPHVTMSFIRRFQR